MVTPTLSDYQEKLLHEMRKNPQLMKLLSTIFKDYPSIIIEEFKLGKAVTGKNQKAAVLATKARLNLEAFVEAEICKLYGINTGEIQAETGTYVEEEEDNVAAALKKVQSKKATKATKKTATKK